MMAEQSTKVGEMVQVRTHRKIPFDFIEYVFAAPSEQHGACLGVLALL